MSFFSSRGLWMLLAILASALLSGLYANGGLAYLLGFVMLVPWLRSLDTRSSLATSLVSAWAMSIAFSAAVFAWFGSAIGSYTQVGAGMGLFLLLLGAPLFQPQIVIFALVRHLAIRRYGVGLGICAGVAAWLASEAVFPKLLGDTLGHGLYPSLLLRQAADLGGAAGLTCLLLLSNEALAQAWARRAQGLLAWLRPLALAAVAPLLLLSYGVYVSHSHSLLASTSLRMGLIQSNIVDYEQQRKQYGADAVVRKVLDAHFAMSYDAVVRQQADAVLWSETTYPTTFGNPKSTAGAELDQAILEIVKAAGVPFIFGTYDRDAAGEYNAAAFVMPQTGLLGFYRKTRLFPFTEYVPAWLDGPELRRILPWAGNWRHGDGARVYPLRLADGREIPVLPLICRDDVDSSLAIAGARLGAQAILTMSNDAWFTQYPQGARLHQAVAAFRSIETRLPQFRVTTNGYSGVIDPLGNLQATSRMGEQTLVVASMPVRQVLPTLIVRWGDWLGGASLALLGLLLLHSAQTAFCATPLWRKYSAKHAALKAQAHTLPLKVAVLPPAARYLAGGLRIFARASLLCLGFAILQSDAMRGNTLAQLRSFTAFFLLPEVVAYCVLLAFAARASIDNGCLVFTQGGRRMSIALQDIAALEIWRLPLPGPGLALRLVTGKSWKYGLALAQPAALAAALQQATGNKLQTSAPSRATLYAEILQATRRGLLDQALAKFVLLPFLLALPAYYLHQHIAFGSGFGEFTSFGWRAYLTGFAIWWAAWCIGVTAFGAALRVVIEISAMLSLWLQPNKALQWRGNLELLGKLALYIGVPGWLLMRVLGS